jgi:stage II sporulation protein D
VDGSPITLFWGRFQRVYPGALEFTVSSTGKQGSVRIVNDAPLEEYVRGVMASEVPASFHPEALKAFAVAARTYAVACQRHHGGQDLCDTTHCQVYRGVGSVPRAIDRAVAETRGLFALYEGQPIEAVYCADCGGRTEAPENAWHGAKPLPYLRPVDDAPAAGAAPYCSVDPQHAWQIRLSPADLRRLASNAGAACEAGRLRLLVTAATESGHVRGLALCGEPPPASTDGPDPDVDNPAPANPILLRYTGAEWRRLLGAERFRSMRFTVRADEGGGAVLDGTGFGHGVGLCQFGADGMARSAAAADFQAILRHYYTGITIGPLPAEVTAKR